ncbi:uncharacterized protein JCM6883_004591 [Sporobolomyces salmoneus]|uniref:uncharacterized protein n=1 Tax=Sporobolomyces salmoneus TaxID=183962 RepID=UPI003170CA2A
MSESDEFDHYLSDNDLDLASFDQLEQSINSTNSIKQPAPPPPPPRAAAVAQSRAVPPTRPLPARPVQPGQKGISSVRPSNSFLRPPKPPPRQNRPPTQAAAVVTSPTKPPQKAREESAAAAPPAKKRRVSLNEQGQEGFVDPNPFSAKTTRVNAIKEEDGAVQRNGGSTVKSRSKPEGEGEREGEGEGEYVEENMPEIRLREGKDGEMLGYELEPKRGTTVLPKQTTSKVELNPVVETRRSTPQRLVRRANGNQNIGNGVGGGGPGSTEEDGERNRSSSVARPLPEGAVVSEARAEHVNGAVRQDGMSDLEKRELEELRREKDKFQSALKAAEQERNKIQEELFHKAGESNLVRKRLKKAEEAHQIALKEEIKEREKIEAALQAKEQELHNERERAKTKAAFAQIEQQQNMVASARKSAHRPQMLGSSQRTITRGARGASVPASGGRMREGESPSIGRSRGERSSSARPSQQLEPPAQQQSTFANFHNSFADSPKQLPAARRSPRRNHLLQDKDKNESGQREETREQEGSMAPPPFPMTGGKSRKSALRSAGKERPIEDKKGKGKEVDEDDSFFSEGHGGEVSFDTTITDIGGRQRYVIDQDQAEGEEETAADWEWVEEERDWRGEILGAVFSHTTFSSIDTNSLLPLTGSLPTQLRATGFTGSTAPQSRSHAFSVSTFTARSTYQPTSTRSSTSMSRQNSHTSTTSYSPLLPPDPQASTGPVPTFHSLMNLRSPPNSSAELITSYELATRNLFTLLGRRMDPRLLLPSQPTFPYPTQADFDPSSSASHLCSNLSHSFQTLLSILDEAGLIGPITALLSLINHLVYLFPLFAQSILENSTTIDDEVTTSTTGGMIKLVAKMVSRYGKPSPPTSTSQASTAPMKLQNSRSRPATRISASRAKKRAAKGEEDRVLIEDAEKRESLLKELTALVEGLAWRYTTTFEGGRSGRSAEEQFTDFLRTPFTISTLFDPTQPVAILLSTSRTLALLAARTVFYREILAIKIADASDVRQSRMPIFDRIATLLNLQSDSPHLFDLHSALLVLSSSLLTHQPDALRLIAESPRFIPDGLLKRIHGDVEAIWDWDGRSVGTSGTVRTLLRRTTQRLYSCVTLLYYLLFAPHSSLSLATINKNSKIFRSNGSSSTSRLSYASEWSQVALGTLAFTETLPSWAELEDEGLSLEPFGEASKGGREAGEGEEGARLIDMKYLAQEILEEAVPDELEAIGECFGVFDEYEEEEEAEVRSNVEEDRMEE